MNLFFQDEKSGGLGERLVLAGDLALEVADASLLDVDRLALATAPRLERRCRRSSPLGELRLVNGRVPIIV